MLADLLGQSLKAPHSFVTRGTMCHGPCVFATAVRFEGSHGLTENRKTVAPIFEQGDRPACAPLIDFNHQLADPYCVDHLSAIRGMTEPVVPSWHAIKTATAARVVRASAGGRIHKFALMFANRWP